ncbi:hypothetical protein LA55_1222 [Francisella philomiragia]|uniref:Uncharacterized protein n=2 Tax=Francisella philomiragia TaxID=28110 RepID=A0A0B6D2E7_9GAMM|nr:hypothetical protein LA55_1222 [Francisella philomiragia]
MGSKYMIKIHFTYSNNWISKAIKFFSVSKFSHVEIEIDEICYSAKPFKGVYAHSYADLCIKEANIQTFSINTDVTEEQKSLLKLFLEEQVSKGYDYKAVLGCALWKRDWENDDKRWFCSELIASAMNYAGLELTNKFYKPHRLIPEDLAVSLRLKVN